MPVTNNCLPLREVASRLSISPRTVARLVASGSLASIKIGRRRLIRADVLAAFIDQHVVRAG